MSIPWEINQVGIVPNYTVRFDLACVVCAVQACSCNTWQILTQFSQLLNQVLDSERTIKHFSRAQRRAQHLKDRAARIQPLINAAQ